MSEIEIHPDPDEDVIIHPDPEADVQVLVEEEEAEVHVEPDAVPSPETADDVEIPQDFEPLEFEPLGAPPVLPWLVGKVDGRAVWVDPADYIGIATDHGLLSGLADDDHVMYLHKKAYGGAASQVPNHLHTSGDDGGTITVPPAGPPDASYVVLGTHANLTNERVLTAGVGVSLTDNGSGSTLVLAVVAAGVDHGSLGGLTDDDHQQYVLRSILTTNGDMFIRAGGVVDRLAVGAATKVLGVTAGLPAWQAQSYIDHGSLGGLTDDDHAGYALATHAFAVIGSVPARLTSGRKLTAGTGISLTDGGAGGNLTITNIGITTNFTQLADVPATYAGSASYFVKVKSDETGLVFSNFIPASIEYQPLLAPTSPDAKNDEFDDLSVAAAWTQVNGGGATRSVNETLRKGFLYISNLDGGGGSDTGLYKAFVPGAVAFTVVAHVFRNVKNAGSNQANLQIFDGSGAFIYGVGALQNYQFIVNDSGGFRTYNSIGYLQGDIGELWLMISRTSGTAYSAYVSGDGMIWHRLEGASRTGTVGRAKIVNVSFSSSMCEAWWDFVRFFTTETFTIGGTP